LKEILSEYGINISNEAAEKLSFYIEKLLKAPFNLTSISDFRTAVHKHVADVLLPVRNIEGKLLDIGTGSGVVGVVLCAIFPIEAVLLDSSSKKIAWLRCRSTQHSLRNIFGVLQGRRNSSLLQRFQMEGRTKRSRERFENSSSGNFGRC